MDSRKPLTAGEIEELKALLEAEKYSLPLQIRRDYASVVQYGYYGCDLEVDDTMHALICGAVNALPRLLSMLTPPPDAAVKEAVERITFGVAQDFVPLKADLEVLLRAVQTPRLTGVQMEAVRNVNRKTESRQCICGDGYLCARCEILCDLLTAFPELTGEVCRGE